MDKHTKKGPWTPSEDEALLSLVQELGPQNWVRIASSLQLRSPKQCRERYHQNLKPSLNKSPISDDEGAVIEELVGKLGKKWAEIARLLNNGRSDNAIKNWWNGGANKRKRARPLSSNGNLITSMPPGSAGSSSSTEGTSAITGSRSGSFEKVTPVNISPSATAHESPASLAPQPLISQALPRPPVSLLPSAVAPTGNSTSAAPINAAPTLSPQLRNCPRSSTNSLPPVAFLQQPFYMAAHCGTSPGPPPASLQHHSFHTPNHYYAPTPPLLKMSSHPQHLPQQQLHPSHVHPHAQVSPHVHLHSHSLPPTHTLSHSRSQSELPSLHFNIAHLSRKTSVSLDTNASGSRQSSSGGTTRRSSLAFLDGHGSSKRQNQQAASSPMSFNKRESAIPSVPSASNSSSTSSIVSFNTSAASKNDSLKVVHTTPPGSSSSLPNASTPSDANSNSKSEIFKPDFMGDDKLPKVAARSASPELNSHLGSTNENTKLPASNSSRSLDKTRVKLHDLLNDTETDQKSSSGKVT